jgi:hypothetical protein
VFIVSTEQEEILEVLHKFEDQAYAYLESPSKYAQGRAKLAARLNRHRGVSE